MPGVATETHPMLTGGISSNKFYGNLFCCRTHEEELGNLTTLDVTDNKTNDNLSLIISKRNYVMSDIFHREDERIKTFENWPLAWLDKNVLAQTGVFYTGDGDKVKCYFCEVEIGRWEPEDHPVTEHLRWSPNCPLLRRRTTNNVPLNIEALDRLLPPMSYDICGSNDAIEIRPNSYSEGAIRSLDEGPASSSASSSNYFPEYPEYAIESARLRSFAEWPRNMKQKPEQLAEAGFFYTGLGDRVKCFSCGGGLKDWDDCDEPWEQHALWLNKCRFLKLMKGEQYIGEVLTQHKAKEAEACSSSESESENGISCTTSLPTVAAAANATTACNMVATSCVASSKPQETEAHVSNCSIPLEASLACLKAPESLPACGSGSGSGTPTNIPEEKMCKICYAAEYNTAFLPCGHVVACAKCASSVTKCPLCRKPFTDVMRVYFS